MKHLSSIKVSIIIFLITLTSISFSFFNCSEGENLDNADWIITSDWEIYANEPILNKTICLDCNISLQPNGRIIIGPGGELVLSNITLIFNSNSNHTPLVKVNDGGFLEVFNSRIIPNNSNKEFNLQIIFAEGSEVHINNSLFSDLSQNISYPGIECFTSQMYLINNTFSDNSIGLTLKDVTDVTVRDCLFLNNYYGVEIYNSNNVQFLGCRFIDNIKLACVLNNSGTTEGIFLVNGTIEHETNNIENKVFQLESSNLSILNVTYENINDLAKKVVLDNQSELNICWYLNLQTTDKKENPIGDVKITIIDKNEIEVITYVRTDESGRLLWIALKEKTFYMDGEIEHNPFTITASKKGKNKYSYKDLIKINSTNSAQNLIIKMTKKEDKDELDLEYTLWVMCICFIVIISVFTILLSINIYLVRKKAGLSRLGGAGGLDKGKESKSRVHGSEVITCSECGTEITEDALFCPHCGEFFEGDEFTCSGCHYKLSEDATSCPKCGKIFDHKAESRSRRKDRTGLASGGEEIDVTSDKLFCSDCGAVVDDKDSRCPGCGLSFSDDYGKGGLKKETQLISPSSKGVKRAYKVTAKDEERIKKREIESVVGDDSYICSMCGGAVNERATTCPSCGTELE